MTRPRRGGPSRAAGRPGSVQRRLQVPDSQRSGLRAPNLSHNVTCVATLSVRILGWCHQASAIPTAAATPWASGATYPVLPRGEYRISPSATKNGIYTKNGTPTKKCATKNCGTKNCGRKKCPTKICRTKINPDTRSSCVFTFYCWLGLAAAVSVWIRRNLVHK